MDASILIVVALVAIGLIALVVGLSRAAVTTGSRAGRRSSWSGDGGSYAAWGGFSGGDGGGGGSCGGDGGGGGGSC